MKLSEHLPFLEMQTKNKNMREKKGRYILISEHSSSQHFLYCTCNELKCNENVCACTHKRKPGSFPIYGQVYINIQPCHTQASIKAQETSSDLHGKKPWFMARAKCTTASALKAACTTDCLSPQLSTYEWQHVCDLLRHSDKTKNAKSVLQHKKKVQIDFSIAANFLS